MPTKLERRLKFLGSIKGRRERLKKRTATEVQERAAIARIKRRHRMMNAQAQDITREYWAENPTPAQAAEAVESVAVRWATGPVNAAVVGAASCMVGRLWSALSFDVRRLPQSTIMDFPERQKPLTCDENKLKTDLSQALKYLGTGCSTKSKEEAADLQAIAQRMAAGAETERPKQTYSKADLCRITGWKNGAITRYTKMASVRAAPRGAAGRAHRWTEAEVVKIFRKIVEKASEDRVVSACKAWLELVV